MVLFGLQDHKLRQTAVFLNKHLHSGVCSYLTNPTHCKSRERKTKLPQKVLHPSSFIHLLNSFPYQIMQSDLQDIIKQFFIQIFSVFFLLCVVCVHNNRHTHNMLILNITSHIITRTFLNHNQKK